MGRGALPHARSSGEGPELTALLDTNVLIRHLTGDPPELATRATAALGSDEVLLLTDLVFAECIYVLESFYEVARPQVATFMRSALALSGVQTLDPGTLRRALYLYERERLDFAESYLVATAEATGVGAVMSFDRAIDRVATVRRIEP